MAHDDRPVKRRRKKRDEGEDRLVLEPQPRLQPPRDKTGRWRREVAKMARGMGWPEQMLWYWFDQLAGCIEHEQGIARPAAEHGGWRLLQGMFNKQGQDWD